MVVSVVGSVGDEVPIETQDVDRVLGRPEHRPGHDGGADGVQRESERADDAEVPPTAPQRPEQVRVVMGRRPDDVALGGDHLGVHQVVDGEPVLAHEPADAAPEAQAADSGVPDDAARCGQAVCLGLVVDVAPQGAALDVGGAFDRIDRDGAHFREVDHDAVVAHRGAGNVVTSASDRDLELADSGESHRGGDVGGAVAAGDESGSSVDSAVPHGAGAVVPLVVERDQVSPESGNLQRGRSGHGCSSGRGAHRIIGRHRGEVSDLDSDGRNLDFTALDGCGTLRS